MEITFFEKDVTKNLHDQRISIYADLFKYTERLTLHDVSVELIYGDAYETTKRLTDWYYKGKGGVLMTKKSEEKYVLLKKVLDAYADLHKLDTKLSIEDSIDIKKLCSDFHNALRNELGVK